jgi:DNA-binding transcriptional regulator YdaS (Cro superfamily)
MSIKVLDEAVKRLGSQKAVAERLGIKPQRLNNWLTSKRIPEGWSWGLAERLKK